MNEEHIRKGLFFMKNTYVTGFFPFIAILLFSSSLAISSVIYAMQMLSSLGNKAIRMPLSEKNSSIPL